MKTDIAILRIELGYKIKMAIWSAFNFIGQVSQNYPLIHQANTIYGLVQENKQLALKLLELKRRNRELKNLLKNKSK